MPAPHLSEMHLRDFTNAAAPLDFGAISNDLEKLARFSRAHNLARFP
jgi:hypothetical protein